MKPKIISVGYAVPKQSYPQEEIFEALGYPSKFRRIFLGSQIDERHFWVPMWERLTWQEATDQYREGAIYLTREVIKACLDGRDPALVSCIAFASCTGYECPSVVHHVAKEMGFSPDVCYASILGMGCEGGYPALRRAYDYTFTHGKPSLAVSCEICSVCCFPEEKGRPDPTRDYELLRANAIFGDGASSVLIGFDENPRHPYLIDFESYFDPANMKHLGFLWQDGRLRCLLSRQVPKIVPELVEIVLDRLLLRNSLETKDINWWVVHPGGKAILDNVRDKLGLPEEKLSSSREALRLYGNCSSSSIGIVGKLLMDRDVKRGDWGLVVSLGAGLAAGATLLHWGEE